MKPVAFFKKQRASKVPIHLHDKVNRVLDILEQYGTISPVNKEEQPKGNTFINPVIILAKKESIKKVLHARYLNSLIDESNYNWPIEPIQFILTKINDKYCTTAGIKIKKSSSSVEKVQDRSETCQNLAVGKFWHNQRGTSHPISRSIRNYDADEENLL